MAHKICVKCHVGPIASALPAEASLSNLAQENPKNAIICHQNPSNACDALFAFAAFVVETSGAMLVAFGIHQEVGKLQGQARDLWVAEDGDLV